MEQKINFLLYKNYKINEVQISLEKWQFIIYKKMFGDKADKKHNQLNNTL